MPVLRRAGKPTLHYALDDYTDPWRHAPHLLLLRARRKRPGSRRTAAKQDDEIAPSYT